MQVCTVCTNRQCSTHYSAQCAVHSSRVHTAHSTHITQHTSTPHSDLLLPPRLANPTYRIRRREVRTAPGQDPCQLSGLGSTTYICEEEIGGGEGEFRYGSPCHCHTCHCHTAAATLTCHTIHVLEYQHTAPHRPTLHQHTTHRPTHATQHTHVPSEDLGLHRRWRFAFDVGGGWVGGDVHKRGGDHFQSLCYRGH